MSENLPLYMCGNTVAHMPSSVAQLGGLLTGDQEVVDSTPAGSATFFRGDLIMK